MNDATGPEPVVGTRLRYLKVVALVVLVLVLGADLATKAWFADLLGMDPGSGGPFLRVEVIEGFFALEGTYNRGVTFGLAPGRTEAILVFTIIATVALFAWLLATRRRSLLLHIALGMVLGGALGNLYDRILWHKVRDFFLVYVGEFRWPNFNVADSMIVVGVILILWLELFGRRAPHPASVGAGTTSS